MTGPRFSTRAPTGIAANAWAEARDRARTTGIELVDLTEANPARVGLGPDDATTLAPLADRAALAYEPDPRGLEAARKALAEYYAAAGATIDPGQVVLTSGTSESYAHVFRLLCDAGDSVLVPQPSYPLFEPLARAEGVRVRPYRLAWDGRWHLDFDSLERAHEPLARAVVVVEPHHPAGSRLDAREHDRLAEWCAARGLAVIADEVFADYPPPGEERGAGWASERRALTFVLSGLSKVCGLPQMKVGWIVTCGPGPDRARALEGLEWLADLFLSVATPAQIALPRWLGNRIEFQDRVRARIATNRRVLRGPDGRQGERSEIGAGGGWVALLKLPGRLNDEAWSLALLERGVVVHPGHFYDLEGGSFAVVSLIVPTERFSAGIERLDATLDDTR